MSNAINITQEQWAELTETLRTAAQWAEQWSKEREGLATMLGEAHKALKGAQEDAQAADQRSCELMGLYGWAGTATSSSRGTKVEIFQDPRSYDSLASKFEEWWTKMNAWLECHLKQFQEKDVQGHNIPALKPRMYVVLSRLKGSKGSHYAKMELKKLADGKSLLSPSAAEGLGPLNAKEAQANRQHVYGCFHHGVHETKVLHSDRRPQSHWTP